ncbi:MAG: LytTR family transcriptional regulator [Bacteroidales bacterium]|nr:LytTR family transcriptional regulator [Bacteroidales bacterium]
MLLTLFFTILVVVFFQPDRLLAHTSHLSPLDDRLQAALMATAGIVTLGVSRLLLMRYGSRHALQHMTILIWLLAELIVMVATMSLTAWAAAGGGKLMLPQLATDLMLTILLVEAIPYVITILVFRLNAEHAEVQRLQAIIDATPQHSPTPAAERTLNFYDKGGRLAFSTQAANVLYIEAADNYVNIHYMNEEREDTFILHNTLKELEQRLADSPMMRCHRGYLVNLDNVKLLRREGSQLLIELDGSPKTIPVTKTYAAAVTERLAPQNT